MKSKLKARLPPPPNEMQPLGRWPSLGSGSPLPTLRASIVPVLQTPRSPAPPQLPTFPFDSNYGGPAIPGQQTRLRLSGGSWSLGPVNGFPWMVGWLGLEQMPDL